MRARRSERGQTTVFIVGLALLTFAIAGLAVDGTRAFLRRRTLQAAADGAALAGAGELDRSAYYRSGGRRAVIDTDAARLVAASWLARRGLDVAVGIETGPDGVRVVLRDLMPTTFLGLLGVAGIPVAVEARAEPVTGNP